MGCQQPWRQLQVPRMTASEASVDFEKNEKAGLDIHHTKLVIGPQRTQNC